MPILVGWYHLRSFSLQVGCVQFPRSELSGLGFGPYSVAELPNFHVVLKDGCKIATKV